MKKCQRCGTICQDPGVACGVCGGNIANSPILRGAMEEDMLRDQKELDRERTLLNQMRARESKRRLVRKLLVSMAATVIGLAAVIFGAVQGHDIRLLSYDTYNPTYEYVFVADILVIIGGTLLIMLGLHFGTDVGTSVRLSFVPVPAEQLSSFGRTSLNLRGVSVSKMRQNENEPPD